MIGFFKNIKIIPFCYDTETVMPSTINEGIFIKDILTKNLDTLYLSIDEMLEGTTNILNKIGYSFTYDLSIPINLIQEQPNSIKFRIGPNVNMPFKIKGILYYVLLGETVYPIRILEVSDKEYANEITEKMVFDIEFNC